MYLTRDGTLSTFNKSIESIEDVTTPYIEQAQGIPVLLDMCTWNVGLVAGVEQVVPDCYKLYSTITCIKYVAGSAPTFVIHELPIIVYATYLAIEATETGTYLLGIPYTSTLETMPIEVGDGSTASRGDIARIHRATLMFYRTMYAKIYTNYNEDIAIDYRATEAIATEDTKIDLPHSPDRQGIVGVKVDLPTPCTVLGLVLKGASYE